MRTIHSQAFEMSQISEWNKLDGGMANTNAKLMNIGDQSQAVGAVSDETHSLSQSCARLSQSMQDLKVDMENFKVTSAQQNQQFQGAILAEVSATRNSLSSAIAVASQQQSTGAHSRVPDTRDADKKLQTIVKISGEESSTELTEWYTKAYIKLESVVPG